MEMRAVQSMKRPKLFWVSAGAPLVSVIVSTLLVFASKANNHGISVVSSCMNYEYPQTEKVRNYLVKCFTIITKVFNWFCLADWKITRRIEPTNDVVNLINELHDPNARMNHLCKRKKERT